MNRGANAQECSLVGKPWRRFAPGYWHKNGSIPLQV
jgi:hypothetical protein